ncbi:MAG: hypothetical protein ABIH72_00360 [archaeon]
MGDRNQALAIAFYDIDENPHFKLRISYTGRGSDTNEYQEPNNQPASSELPQSDLESKTE